MGTDLTSKAVALVGRGTPLDRATAVALAEAGANLALATVSRNQEQEFAMNSIANEAWVIGREQFVAVIDAFDEAAVQAFAEEACDRYGECAALVVNSASAEATPIDELSKSAWEAQLAANLTVPLLCAQAFGRLMEREGGGRIVFLAPQTPGNLAGGVASAALRALASAIDEAWQQRQVTATVIETTFDGRLAAEVLAAIEG